MTMTDRMLNNKKQVTKEGEHMCKVKHSDKAMKLGSLFLMATVCGVLLFQSSNLHANWVGMKKPIRRLFPTSS